MSLKLRGFDVTKG